jgi:hypothetical protein
VKPLEFSPQRALEALSRSGYYHCANSTPRSLLDPFLEEYGLVASGPSQYTITLTRSEKVRMTRAEVEELSRRQAEKRQKAAQRKKQKQTTT